MCFAQDWSDGMDHSARFSKSVRQGVDGAYIEESVMKAITATSAAASATAQRPILILRTCRSMSRRVPPDEPSESMYPTRRVIEPCRQLR